MSWRLRDLVVDAVRNVAGSPTRTVLLALVAAGVVGGLVFTELAFTQDLLDFRARFDASGGHVVIATNDDGLPVARCVALADLDGVVAAAALDQAGPVETNLAPGTLFQTGRTTTGALRLFTTDPHPTVAAVADRWVLGRAAADELGVEAGMWLAVDDAARQVGAVIDTEARNPQVARWILHVVPPTGTTTQCWVEYAPGARSGRIELLDTRFADTGDQLVVRPWIRLDEFSRDPLTELAQRPQRAAWVAAGLLLAASVWSATWLRRAHIGLYRAVGTGPAGLLVLGAVEAALPLLVGGIAGALWAAAAWAAATGHTPQPDQALIAARTAASTLLVAVAAAPLLGPLTARQPIADQLKDR
ncbi:MAG TPA: hypothetical protein ENK55_08490 [Actinobacteria bacterium]|nr:hypothetical protein [Actinomycetota bacterium]